ncbi:hypothetical protein ABT160_00540 [Streptomyces sp. NPDC001941]|uniref:hypothetical protein n=1 Tax=Streptomyces sp. NPDC001941 TaxID=3154659 RepID=UPI0033229D11
MNRIIISRAAGAVLAGLLLTGAAAGSAAADENPGGLVRSEASTGLSIGNLLTAGASSTTHTAGGAKSKSGVKVDGPAGAAVVSDVDANVGLDLNILTDLLVGVNGVIDL